MFSGLYNFLKEQEVQQSVKTIVQNPPCQYGLGLGAVSLVSFLFYRLLSPSAQMKEEDFEYIPTIDDLRKLPIQSLLQAYLANDRDPVLSTAFQVALGRRGRGHDEPLTFSQIVGSMLEKLGLPSDGSYPEELYDTNKNAEQIVDWCLERNKRNKAAL